MISSSLTLLLLHCLAFGHTQPNINGSDTIDIEPFSMTIRVPQLDLCEQISTNDCQSLTKQILKCQQIIFNDPGFSHQQYKENIHVHRQILAKYQSLCEGTQHDYLSNDFV